MAVPKIKAVIFDLGNVLLDFDHGIAAKKIARLSHKSIEEIFNLFFDSPLTGMFEEGRISEREFFSGVKKMLGLKIDFKSFLPVWNEIFFFSEKNRAACKIAAGLRAGYKTAVLSNINAAHHKYIKNTFPVFQDFSAVLTSYELGMRKPDPRIYKKAMQALGAAGEEIFYTDDRPELVESAKGLGIHGFTFTGAGQLEKDLASLGIYKEKK